MGGPTCTDRVRAWVPKAGGRCPRGRPQPKSHRHRGLRASDQQPSMGNGTGNVLLQARLTGLSKDSVANVAQIITLDKHLLTDRAGKLPHAKLELVFPELMLFLEGESPVCSTAPGANLAVQRTFGHAQRWQSSHLVGQKRLSLSR